MKFWARIILYSMILFVLIFNGAGIFIIENIHKRSLDRTVRASVSEYRTVEKVVYLNMDVNDFIAADLPMNDNNGTREDITKITDKQLENWLPIAISGYIGNEMPDSVSYEFYGNKGNLLYSDSKKQYASGIEIFNHAKSNERQFIVKNTGEGKKLLIASLLGVFGNKIGFVLVKDVDYLYKERGENYRTFLILDLFVFIFLSAGMYMIARSLTKPLEKFNEASQEFTEGNYSKRVCLKNKRDEIGILAENFNIMAQAIGDTIQELQKNNEAKQRFIDSLTHEMKTPLTSIIGYSDLLVKSNLKDEEVRIKALNYINSEAKRLENLCFALLKLILIKQEDLNIEEICLNGCIADVCCTMSFKTEEKNIKVGVEGPDALVKGDRQLIMIMLVNILDNAVKASKEGDRIEISTSKLADSGNPVIFIRDYGVGIPEEDIDKIREPFYMVDKARDRAKKGVGLGLAIVDEICRVHNIRLDITSRIGKGTLVKIEFCEEGKLP